MPNTTTFTSRPLETAELVRLLEDHQIHADRGRVWRVTEGLGLRVRGRRPGARRHWTPDQAQLVLLAFQLRIRRGLSPRAVVEIAAGNRGRPDPIIDELEAIYRRVAEYGGLAARPATQTAAA